MNDLSNSRRMTVERLNARTEQECADSMHGYQDGFAGNPPPAFASDYYDHGREQGVSDATKEVSRDQRRLAWELMRLKRSATEAEWAHECFLRGLEA